MFLARLSHAFYKDAKKHNCGEFRGWKETSELSFLLYLRKSFHQFKFSKWIFYDFFFFIFLLQTGKSSHLRILCLSFSIHFLNVYKRYVLHKRHFADLSWRLTFLFRRPPVTPPTFYIHSSLISSFQRKEIASACRGTLGIEKWKQQELVPLESKVLPVSAVLGYLTDLPYYLQVHCTCVGTVFSCDDTPNKHPYYFSPPRWN